MKYLIAVVLMAFAVSANSQMLTYTDALIEHEGQMVRTINVKLDPKPDEVRSSFESWMDDNYNVDLDGKKLIFFERDVMKAQGVVIPEISDRRIDLMVTVDETYDDATNLHVFASFGYDNWITLEKYPVEFIALENIVYTYVSTYLPEFYQEKVEDTQVMIDKLEEDRSELKDEVADNKEEMERLLQENEELKVELRQNQKKISQHKSKLKQKNKDLEVIKSRVDNK